MRLLRSGQRARALGRILGSFQIDSTIGSMRVSCLRVCRGLITNTCNSRHIPLDDVQLSSATNISDGDSRNQRNTVLIRPANFQAMGTRMHD